MPARLSTLFALTAMTAMTAGCGGSSSDSARTSTAGPKSAPKVSNAYALQYTGGQAGTANRQKSPVTIGYINQQGAAPSFPEATVGMQAAAKYINNELGGVQGHPLRLESCFVQTEEDGQKCATQMVNDDSVKFVILGVVAVGNRSIYSVLSGRKPILSGNPSTADDFVAKDTVAYTSGTPGIIAGMATFAATRLKAKNITLLVADNAAGKNAAKQIFEPLVKALGVTKVELAPVGDTATAPQVASAIQAAGGRTADTLVSFLPVPGCIATYDALQSLGIKPKVLATGLCFGTPMTKHLQQLGSKDQVPDGWYFAAFGYSYFQDEPADSGMPTYLAKIRQYGPKDVEYTGFAGYIFATLLTADKLVTQVGVDKLSPATIRPALANFKGPMMLTPGKMDCGFSTALPVLCGSKVGIEQYAGGKWLPTALGAGAIDVRKALGG